MMPAVVVLVTGCAGFIGSHLTERLLASSGDIVVIGLDVLHVIGGDGNAAKSSHVRQIREARVRECVRRFGDDRFKFVQEDVRSTDAIARFRPAAIVHLAALAGVRDSLERVEDYVDVNVKGQAHMLTQALRAGVRLFLYASSSSVYGLRQKSEPSFSETDPLTDAPNSPYACTKKAAEELAHMYCRLYAPRLRAVGLRFFTVYGPRGRPDMCPDRFLRAVRDGGELHVYGDASAIFRDFTYVGDIVDGICAVLQQELVQDTPSIASMMSEVFNLGSGRRVSLHDFIRTCEDVVKETSLPEARSLSPHRVVTHPPQRGDVPETLANIEKARARFGYAPKCSLHDGLRACLHGFL